MLIKLKVNGKCTNVKNHRSWFIIKTSAFNVFRSEISPNFRNWASGVPFFGSECQEFFLLLINSDNKIS